MLGLRGICIFVCIEPEIVPIHVHFLRRIPFRGLGENVFSTTHVEQFDRFALQSERGIDVPEADGAGGVS